MVFFIIMMPKQGLRPQRGATMIEVLVTIVILTFGLLGLAGLQGKLQQAEMESYQRSQALILLDDMAGRLADNPTNAASYLTGTSPMGTGNPACTAPSGASQAVKDLCDWNNSLLGSTESSSSGNVGAMIGARGCVEQIDGTNFLVSVAWQGLGPLSRAQGGGSNCGNGLYNTGSGGNCPAGQDTCRRIVSTVVATN